MGARAILLTALALLGGCGGEESRNMSASEVAGALDSLPIEPGLWEIASDVTDVGAPNLPVEVQRRMIGPRQRLRSCVTPEQAARPSAGFLAAREAGQGCSYADFAMQGGRMTGTMRCAEPDGGATVARMDGTYRRDQYVLRMAIETPMPDGVTMRIGTRTTGRRIGACVDPGQEGNSG
ncbi:DUF3617 domain-containing protein [Sphingosinicella sp. LHD-64]|uniref:DUF3617 domain-containing protein n=1 Tax=Sphingosinicella sp. LHD-64 TaxID=3072139 RepID=UPI00280CDAD6|nr:DUF3617 domain-containing protein [Sphingosinicella sp. LHD-64]MDQ8758062.1 DUF3617 domain-containing protein [Sphingosinicella sp. LHD-64]